MKARVWLLLLLAVLLPFRGAAAAAMLCPPAAGTESELHLVAGHHAHAVATQPSHEHAVHDQHDDAGKDTGNTADKCNLCSASCSMTPLLGSVPAVFAACDVAATSFPDLSVPAITFLSAGQERPPRSI